MNRVNSYRSVRVAKYIRLSREDGDEVESESVENQRDHIDTGYYLERYLPAKTIRYIAIGDNVDTLKSDGLQFIFLC